MMLRAIIFVFVILSPSIGFAQAFSNSAQSGAGGVSYFAGMSPESAFKNPSFLMLADNNERFGVTLFSGGVYRNAGYTSNIFNNLDLVGTPFTGNPIQNEYLFEKDSNQLISAWFEQNSTTSTHKQELDLVTFGFMYKRTDMSFSLNHRMRGTSISELSKGWFDAAFQSNGQSYFLDRNLSQYSSFRHEIALGFAWEQALISGLIGNRSAIFVGINPKVILPVDYMDATYTSQSSYSEPESQSVSRTQNLEFIGSGNSCSMMTANPFVCSTTNTDWMNLSGYGAGFDAGITWRFSLGDGIRLREDLRPVSNYQISLMVAVSDVGFLTHTNSRKIETGRYDDTIDRVDLRSLNREYAFSAQSFFDFISTSNNLIAEPTPSTTESVTYLIPSTLSAGIGLELNKVKFAMEYQQQSGNQNPIGDYSSMHIGNEIQLIPYLSVRSGVILTSNEPVVYTAGIGLETGWLTISASTMAQQLPTNDTFRPVMMNVGSLSLRF